MSHFVCVFWKVTKSLIFSTVFSHARLLLVVYNTASIIQTVAFLDKWDTQHFFCLVIPPDILVLYYQHQCTHNFTYFFIYYRKTVIVSKELQHVRVFSINRDICRSRYGNYIHITYNMLCSSQLDVGGRDQCTHDSGSPLYHNNVVVGIFSFRVGRARPCYPSINANVTRFTDWIRRNTKPPRSNYQTLKYKVL